MIGTWTDLIEAPRRDYPVNADTSKKSDERHTSWQVNLHSLLSGKLTHVATGISWPVSDPTAISQWEDGNNHLGRPR